MRGPLSAILLLLCALPVSAQQPPPGQDYRRKEEIIYQAKRYRIHNNYVTFGPGFLGSTIRRDWQKCIGADYTFHIRTQHFQLGAMMSGEAFLSNNNIEAKAGYVYRRETLRTNFALSGGPTWFTGVRARTDPSTGLTQPDFYNGFGGYVTLQGVTKFYYDFGLGLELYAHVSYVQRIFGFRVVAYFSGAYRGLKRNYNPNVRSENPNG